MNSYRKLSQSLRECLNINGENNTNPYFAILRADPIVLEYLAWAFIEAATYAAMHYPEIKSWYERKKRRRNISVAKKALACKLAKSVWHVMNGKDFDMKLMFG